VSVGLVDGEWMQWMQWMRPTETSPAGCSALAAIKSVICSRLDPQLLEQDDGKRN